MRRSKSTPGTKQDSFEVAHTESNSMTLSLALQLESMMALKKSKEMVAGNQSHSDDNLEESQSAPQLSGQIRSSLIPSPIILHVSRKVLFCRAHRNFRLPHKFLRTHFFSLPIPIRGERQLYKVHISEVLTCVKF
jgi:hypothetical protein